MPGTMAEADPCGHCKSNGSNTPTSLIVEGLLVQPRTYSVKALLAANFRELI